MKKLDLELKAWLIHQKNKSGWIKLSNEEQATLEFLERENKKLPGRKKSVTYIAREKMLLRKKTDKKLKAWGEWVYAGRYTSYQKIDLEHEIVDGEREGYDHCLLSDFDSLMIKLDQVIMNLNEIQKSLIYYEYQSLEHNRVDLWTKKFKRSKQRYRSLKSETVLKIGIMLNNS